VRQGDHAGIEAADDRIDVAVGRRRPLPLLGHLHDAPMDGSHRRLWFPQVQTFYGLNDRRRHLS